MKPFLAAWRAHWRPLAVLGVLLAAAGLAAIPGSSFSAGICTGCAGAAAAPPGDFEQVGCLSCHGEAKTFRNLDNSRIGFQVRDAEGNFLNGPYAADAVYTITVSIDEQVGAEATNHAGFNLRASAGKLAGIEGQSQASADGKQATHVNARSTSWNVSWTAPASGAAAFQVFVNDVDGSGAPDAPDNVHMAWFAVSDPKFAGVGAAAVHEEPHFGISLQQYWIGLIGLAGMILVMVAGFVYLKFVNPHNTDQKDR